MDSNKGVVLVVDDVPTNLNLMTQILKNENYKTLVAINGEAALRVAKRSRPDLILLDVRMPKMDGYEVCRQLKADSELNTIPVIFLSGLTDQADKIKAYKLGAFDFFNKPFLPEEVVVKVKNYIELYRLKSAAQK